MKMLVITDYQNDFVNGALGFPGAEKLAEGIVRLADDIQAGDGVVVVLHDTHGENYLETREGRELPVPHTVPGTPGWELYGRVGEWVAGNPHTDIIKHTFGAPPASMLELPDGVTEIHLVGLVTNMCVISNACVFQARYPDAQIIVHRSLCDSFDKELHGKTFDVLSGMQVRVVD